MSSRENGFRLTHVILHPPSGAARPKDGPLLPRPCIWAQRRLRQLGGFRGGALHYPSRSLTWHWRIAP